MNRQRIAGFTYIELMTVTAIIGILAAILFPVFAKARENARKVVCVNNLKQISLALNLYARDYGGYYPPTNDDLAPLVPYLRDLNVFHCPSDNPPKPVRLVGGKLVNCSYRYFGGLSLDKEGISDTAVAYDRVAGWHDLMIVPLLFLDGHAKIENVRQWPPLNRPFKDPLRRLPTL